MHIALKNLHVMDIGGLSEEIIIDIFTEGGMLPKTDPAPMCPKCEGQTKASTDNSRKLGWVWRCMNRRKRTCSGKANPLSNTFFEKSLINFSDMFILLCLFVWKFPISKALTITNFYRAKREQKQMSSETINDYFPYLFASHNNKLLGGPEESDLDPLSYKDNCDEDLDWENY
ncbi:hypothetical protein CDAR_368631 [Caerostris darwini]|uniref:Transposase n=1 Tax=Caerostris darwini TaxID=1538125 RepID=A0AAV4WWK1_9ARAC|nr:hypothetical protein CDAR_368631 [Caerostris darwini]